MPGPILTSTAQVQCAHGGIATPVTASPKVTIQGQPVVTIATQYTVAGCGFPAMSSGAPPCVKAQFTTAATKVTSYGQFVLLGTSQGITLPNGTPVIVVPNPKNPIAQ
jgi:hypothetical protein